MPLLVQREAEAMWGTITTFSQWSRPGVMFGSSSYTSRPHLRCTLPCDSQDLQSKQTCKHALAVQGLPWISVGSARHGVKAVLLSASACHPCCTANACGTLCATFAAGAEALS